MILTSRSPRAVLGAFETRSAEGRAMSRGLDSVTLMERAGAAAARAILAFDPVPSAVVLCGPGNNGGDGYVVARYLKAAGVAVTVAAAGPPQRNPAAAAAAEWDGPVVGLAEVPPAATLIDALYGISLSRPLGDDDANALGRLAPHAPAQGCARPAELCRDRQRRAARAAVARQGEPPPRLST